MTSSFVNDIDQYYQIPEDAAGAGSVLVDAELIDLATGLSLIDAAQNNLTGETFEDLVLSSREDIVPVVVTNESSFSINVTNRQQSEVATSLLGVERSETALALFSAVNIYGINSKEWTANPGGSFFYTYYTDPEAWTFRQNFGNYRRHIPAESALQAYAYPPPASFAFSSDDNTGRFPGGYVDGVMNAYWETKRTFRYQPGRVTGFTFGTRMSTGSNYTGEMVQWGCRNDYGDGYYFQLERGSDLFIIYRRFNPLTSSIEEIKIPQKEWNGDQVSVNNSATGWVLDLSKVTMFKIEFSWYGAVGAKFLAFVPVDNGEARWVKLHYVIIENQLEFPSLRSAFLKMFIQSRNTAGALSAAFINLYGSSVYIDGGDKGTVTMGSAALSTPKNIDTTSRAILGLQAKELINNVDNQKTIYPVGLTAYSSVPARFDLVLQDQGTVNRSSADRSGPDESYRYGYGTNLVRGSSASIAVTKTSDTSLTIASGSFPDLSAEISGSTSYLTGRRVRVLGSGIFSTHVTAATSSTITTDRPIPAGTTSIQLSRFNAYAVASGVIPSGVVSGTVYFEPGVGQWRLGAWTSTSGQSYDQNTIVNWFSSRRTALNYDIEQRTTGEIGFPFGPYVKSNFTVIFPSGTSNTVIEFQDSINTITTTLTGITSPWPISLVAEVMDNSRLEDVVVVLGNKQQRITPGSGITNAIVQWSAVSGMSQDSSLAGGTNYVANKFEASSSDSLSAALIDSQGYKTLRSPQRIASYFVGSGESKQFDLSSLFGPDKMFVVGKPGTIYNSGALFVMAIARTGSGVASVSLDWEEQ